MKAAQPAVLLIHGIGDTAAVFRKMAADLQRDRQVYSLDLVPNNGACGLERLARQVEAYVRTNIPGAQPLDLVGFSMGGIVARYYVQRLGGIDRVRRFITISSPHRGTWTAFLLGHTGIRQMRPGSAFLADLNRDCGALDKVGFTSLWTRFDLTILPASSSVLPVGRAISLAVAAHPLMVTDRRVLRLVREILAAPV